MSIIEMRVPVIGESITEVTLSEWLVEDGAHVNIDDPICEFESDKATLEFPAEASGKLIHVASEGDDLEIGALVAKIDTSAEGRTHPGPDSPDPTTEIEDDGDTESSTMMASSSTTSHAAGHPSPTAKKILAEKGIDPKTVRGSGKDGRITQNDAENAESTASTKPAILAPINPENRIERTEKLSRMRRTIAKRLVSAKNNTAMLTTFNEVDMTNIFALRKKYQEEFVGKHGIKLGFMSIFAKACAQVLMEMPQVNAFIDEPNIIYHDYVDISIAISTDNGLVVPPIRNVESKSFHEIELEIKSLASKARAGSLTLAEMSGGTFTITNGGIFGSMLSTPILNEPQSAILGMHNIIQRPVAIDGKVEVRPMMYLAMSYDHRVIDGSSSVTFLVNVIKLLENPVRMLINI